MKICKKITGVLLGTILLGLGVSFYKLSSLGQDSLSAMVYSVMYLVNNEHLPYMFWYILINFLFLIAMLFTLRKKINIGTIINFLLTGVFCDLFVRLFLICNLDSNLWFIKGLYGILGLIIISMGIALYAGANLGVAPYDSMPLALGKLCPKISYKYTRIIVDLLCTLIALIIGVFILRRSDIIGFNTILTFIFMGPLITLFSKFFSKYFYQEEQAFK